MRLSRLLLAACAPLSLIAAGEAQAATADEAGVAASPEPAPLPPEMPAAATTGDRFAAPAPALLTPALLPEATMPAVAALTPAAFDLRDATDDGMTDDGALPDLAFGGDAVTDADDGATRYGPVDPAQSLARYDYASGDAPRMANGHIPREYSRFGSFGAQFHQIRWEALAGLVFYTGINSVKFWQNPTWFHFHNEGFFGSNTISLGMDKMVHAYDTYLISEILHHRLHRKTGGVEGDVVTTALIASGLMIYSELYDGIERTAGISMQDVLFNTMGAGFSVLRHSVPNLENILDFRVMIVPDSNIYTRVGKEHYRQQRFLLAFQLSGFPQFRNSPLRFLELHLGYYATGFTDAERARGERPQQRPFFGIGLNVGQLLFGRSRSTIGSAARSVLDYVQIPYTAAHMDITGHITY